MDFFWWFFAAVVLFIAVVGGRQILRILLKRRRKGVASGLGVQVGVRDAEVFRGEEAEGLVTIASSKWFESVEAGLVCTEYYDVEVGSGEDSQTVTREAIAYEVWLPIETAPGEQSVRLAVPPDAPFSYEGDTLSFGWEVVARARRRHGLDALAAQKIKISP